MSNNKIKGITFPFDNTNNNNYILDIDSTYNEVIKSKIFHLLTTKKNQKVRDLDYGLDLYEFLFNPKDKNTFDEIEQLIRESFSKYLPNVSIVECNISETDNTSIILSLKYIITDVKISKEETIQIIFK